MAGISLVEKTVCLIKGILSFSHKKKRGKLPFSMLWKKKPHESGLLAST